MRYWRHRSLSSVFVLLIFPLVFSGRESAGVNWPSFRGPHAAGIAEGMDLPLQWNGESGQSVRWKTVIPGLAHSSPIVWEDRLFVTSAISSQPDATFKHGLFGEGDASNDLSVQQWKVYCINKSSGKILWESTAYEGVPKEKRHVKSTYANSTPATDGSHVVAFFGSQGLYCFDMDGKQLWSKDLGKLDLGLLVTSILPLSRYGEGIDLLEKQQAVKVCFRPWED